MPAINEQRSAKQKADTQDASETNGRNAAEKNDADHAGKAKTAQLKKTRMDDGDVAKPDRPTRTMQWRPRAIFDMESIVVYIGEAQQQPAAAKRTYENIVNEIRKLCDMPTLGRPFADERLTNREYRTWLIGKYRVFYSYDDETLTIWRVIHTSRDIDDYALVDFK
jgi:plasmid stabilization system protein ParE